MPYPNIIRAAVVGLGRAGWNLHFQPLLKHGGFKIVAVADPVADRCQEAVNLTGCQQFNSIENLLKSTDAELVVVATPSSTHYSDTIQVLQSGRHCVTEKPMSLAADEAANLVTLSRQTGKRLFIHHAHLHKAEFQHLRETIKSGLLGRLYHLRTFWGNYARRWDWQTLKKNGGGQLNNTCPHTLSVVLPLLGAPVKSIYADLRNIKDAGDAEDHVHLVMKAGNGVTADVVVTSAAVADIPKWTLCGEYGTLTSDGKKSILRYYNPAEVPPLSVLDAAAPNRKYLKEALPWQEKQIDIPPSTIASFHENIHDVLTGKAEQIVTPESAAEVVRVSEMARLAAS